MSIDYEKEIYVDNAATTAASKEVVEAMFPFFTKNYGNPSSLYSLAQISRDAVDNSREIISNIIKLKRVDKGLWKILDTLSKSESEDNCVEMVELSKNSEFIIPNRERINTI